MELTRTIHKWMTRGRIMFVYRGEINERNSLALLTLLESEMNDDSYGLPGRKRLFMYVLENLQNISKHGEHNGHGDMSVIAYSRSDTGYTITTGNVISSNQIDDLTDRLDLINSSDGETIKRLHRQILATTEFSSKGGAGLGLIEMALKTGNRLDYDFIPINGDHSFFVLSKTVDSSGLGTNPAEGRSQFQSGPFMDLVNLMAVSGIHIVWSGHISENIGDEVLSLTESAVLSDDRDTILRKRVFSIMTELLENASKYGPDKESELKFGYPVTMVRIINEKFLLSTGNLIKSQSVKSLGDKIDAINKLDASGLKDMFSKTLEGQTTESDSTGSLGLIDVARKAGNKLGYRFEAVNDSWSYFMMAVTVDDPVVS